MNRNIQNNSKFDNKPDLNKIENNQLFSISNDNTKKTVINHTINYRNKLRLINQNINNIKKNSRGKSKSDPNRKTKLENIFTPINWERSNNSYLSKPKNKSKKKK